MAEQMNVSEYGTDGDIEQYMAVLLVESGYPKPSCIGDARWNGIVKRVTTDRKERECQK
jgi:hypothetical protein